jgi:hypothetical protein
LISAFGSCPFTVMATLEPAAGGTVIWISTSPPLTISARADSVRTAKPPPRAGWATAGVAASTTAIAITSVSLIGGPLRADYCDRILTKMAVLPLENGNSPR